MAQVRYPTQTPNIRSDTPRILWGFVVYPHTPVATFAVRNELIVGFPENEVVSGQDMAVEQGVR